MGKDNEINSITITAESASVIGRHIDSLLAGQRRQGKERNVAQEVEITPAPEAERIAQDLIAAHHLHLRDECRILYLFTNQKRKTRGKATWASAQKLGPLDRFLESGGEGIEAGARFAIVIDIWIWASLDERQRVALIDHELSHIGVNVDGKGDESFVLLPHDLEEFADIVRRHGLWRPDVKLMAEVMEQLPLFDAAR